jgi:hypothetical protein
MQIVVCCDMSKADQFCLLVFKGWFAFHTALVVYYHVATIPTERRPEIKDISTVDL